MIKAMQRVEQLTASAAPGAHHLGVAFPPNDPAAYGFLASSLASLILLRLFLRESKTRRAREAALAQAGRLETLGRLTGGVAHDFNNLLTVIRGNVAALRRNVTEPAFEPHLDAIDGASDRAIKLIAQLLNFARGGEPEAVRLDLDSVVDRSPPDVRELVGPHLTVQRQRSSTRAQVDIDPVQLQAALLSLAANACAAMPSGGVLEFATRAYQDIVELRVSDTGEGVPPEVLPRVFAPFVTTKAEGRGAGLGLAQVHDLVRRAGGSAQVQSAVGMGTIVILRLPRASGGSEFLSTKSRQAVV